jgi:hypothetical protein
MRNTVELAARAIRRRLVAAVVGLLVAGMPVAGAAFDAAQSFAKGTAIFTLQATGGAQANVEGFENPSDITFVGFAPRVSYLPFDPLGSGWYKITAEPGLEGWFQNYLHPQHSVAGGLKAVLRLHGLGFGPFVPYFEIAGGAGATGLDTPESRTIFTFIIEAGPGFSVLLSRDLAITAGYRFQHFSNGNTGGANRGYEGHSGVVGVSFFFR